MHKYREKTDVELVKLALKDQEEFAQLMERYEEKLLRYIRRFAGLSQECAEDVLQEAFLKIYRNLNDFDTSLKFSSWAYRIVHNETINYIRKHNDKKTVGLETDDPDIVSLIDILESDTDVSGDVAKKELSEKVRHVLATLPAHYREILVLRFLEDMDYSEISDILKKPMGTVATLLNRAKASFKQLALENNLTL